MCLLFTLLANLYVLAAMIQDKLCTKVRYLFSFSRLVFCKR